MYSLTRVTASCDRGGGGDGGRRAGSESRRQYRPFLYRVSDTKSPHILKVLPFVALTVSSEYGVVGDMPSSLHTVESLAQGSPVSEMG